MIKNNNIIIRRYQERFLIESEDHSVVRPEEQVVLPEGSCEREPASLFGKNFPDPTPEMLEDPKFNAIWNCIKSWDINVPEAYSGYCGALGNHVRAILNALEKVDNQENK